MSTSCHDAFYSCCLEIRHRWLVAAISCIGLAIIYIQRTCIYLVIVLGAKRLGYSEGDPHDRCHRHAWSNIDKRTIIYDWTGQEQGRILASFYVGYVLTQIPGGVLALTYGPKRVVCVSAILSSLCTLLFPWALDWDFALLVAARFTLGFVQGPLLPALTQNGVHWAPREERNLLNSIMYSGVALGLMLGNLIPSEMFHRGHGVNWLFYTVAGLGFLWSALWCVYVTNSPIDHPLISLEETKFVWRSIAYDCKAEKVALRLTQYGKKMGFSNINLISIFKSKQNLILALAFFGFDWGFNMVSMELPFYAVDVLRMKVPKISVITVTPWVSMFFGSLIFGGISQVLLSQKIWNNTELRRTMGLISMPVVGICLLVASHEDCATILSASIFSLSGFYCGAAASAQWLTPALLAPARASLVFAFANTVSSISGILVPLTVLSTSPVKERTLSHWIMQFTVTTVIMSVCSLPYILFTETEVQS